MNTLKVKCVLLKAVLPCLQNPILINGEISCLLLICKVGWYRQENCNFDANIQTNRNYFVKLTLQR